MRKIVHVHTELELGEGVLLDADDVLELSLDCFVCRRCRRTVFLRLGLEEGVCTSKNHPFPGVILSKRVEKSGSKTTIDYAAQFWFAPFEDIKRGDQAVGNREWARVRLTLDCPRCKSQRSTTVQTNLVRPCYKSCECGFKLFTDSTQENTTVTDVPLA